jgi:pimeloyl-ACP methyl ester carboxylesterase
VLNLNGTGMPIELAPGYIMTAPGLWGTVTTSEGREAGTRGPEIATEAFDRALANTGMLDIMTIEMDVQAVSEPAGEPAVRTPRNEDGLVLEVPDRGETEGQLVLAIDEDGAMTWNFPVDEQKQVQTPAVRGVRNTKKFLIRRSIPPNSPDSKLKERSIVQVVGRKILKVLVYNITDPVLGAVGEYFVHKWEEKNRPYKIRSFRPDNYSSGNVAALTLQELNKLSAGKALLFIHGTNSSTHTGFFNFPENTLKDLSDAYSGRVFAFDHFTLSEDPEQNVNWFIQNMPSDIRLKVDIICHSRGGLVARTLAGGLKHSVFPQVQVEKIILAGAPDNGTILANAKHITDFIDRYTTVLNLLPPVPPVVEVVADILEGIITVAKVIAHALINKLPGISAMDPEGAFLKRLNSPWDQMNTQYYALAADYEPTGGLKNLVMDELVDRVFGNEHNDLLVPTAGVYTGIQAPGFPIPDSRVLLFPSSKGVAHSFYFVQDETKAKLKEWLQVG